MVMNIAREGFDMFMAIRFSAGNLGQIAVAMSFLIFLVPYVIALRKLRSAAPRPES